MTISFHPPFLANPAELVSVLQEQGHAVIDAQAVATLSACPAPALAAWRPFWANLPSDNFLKDGGRYRKRRHSCFVVNGEQLTQVAHRAHWQPLEYNALHGGMQRLFEPMDSALVSQAAWQNLLLWLGQVCSGLKGSQPWFVEAHQFRIDTTNGIGRPTPEGAHRDGVDMVAVFLVDRQGVKGGETRVFEAAGPNGQRFTLTEPWSLLLLDDARVVHETTPIQPLQPLQPVQADGAATYRDTLVITLRARGFQEDAP
jgi:hypothetical protein